MADTNNPNVIPLRLRRPPDDGYSPPSLRDTILFAIDQCADPHPAERTIISDDYRTGYLDALVEALVDAGMPYRTWEDDISPAARAGLRKLIDLHFDADEVG